MQSLWSKTMKNHHIEQPVLEDGHLPENLHVQNVVIGAGITGILTAYLLQEKGQEVIVLEADRVASGQTKNTTAKITAQHGCIYHRLMTKTDPERAKGYYKANTLTIDMYEKIIQKEGISCHFKRLPSFLYATTEAGMRQLEQEYRAMRDMELDAELIDGRLPGKDVLKELPFPVRGAICMKNQAQFHPLEFIEALAKKLTIYEETRVLSVYNNHVIETNKGVVSAEHIIFACHYPFFIAPGYYFLRQHQSRSYVLALEGKGVPKELPGMYYGVEQDGISLRSEEGVLLFGAGERRTGKMTYCYGDIRKRAAEYYKDATEVAAWAAQDCMPHDGIPFIGTYATGCPDWYVATGFQKWGMSTAMVAAMLISDKITGEDYPYEEVFSPQRLLIRAGIKHFLVDTGVSLIGLIQGLYVNEERVCPHMGCALTQNPEDGVWECSCHGSRFEEDGTLIDNPAQVNLPAKK